MAKDDKIKATDISERLHKGLQLARTKLIEREKKNNGYPTFVGNCFDTFLLGRNLRFARLYPTKTEK